MLLLDHKVSVAWRDRPFGGKLHRSALPQGMSCAEIVASVPDLNTRRFLELGTFCINGEVVPRYMWPFVRPKSRSDIIVTLHMPIRGGGEGSSKDTIRIVAVIALLVIATAITAGAFGPLGASIGVDLAAGTIGAQILAGAVTLGGSLLLGALVKPPAAAVEEDPEQDKGANAALQGNQLKRGSAIPRVVGTHRVYPPFITQPLIDLDEYDEVVEGSYGLAGPHRMRDIKFGEVFADDIDPEQFAYEFYELSDDDNGIDEDTALYIPLTGAQDSVAFADKSLNERAVTASSDAVFIDRREGYVSTSAAYFDGTAHLSVAAVIDFVLALQDWSIDLFCEWDGGATTVGHIIGQTDASLTAAGSSFRMTKTAAGLLEAAVSNGTTFTTLTSTGIIEAGRHHIVLSRIGDVLYLWVDRILQATAVFTGEIPPCLDSLDIGARGASSTTTRWIGWINNVRFEVGRSWYTAGEDYAAVPQIQYKTEEPRLLSRYGKTGHVRILLNEHRILDEQPVQSTRDLLHNQIVPARSLPQAQSVAARGRGFDEVWVTLTFAAGLFYSDDGFDRDWFNGVPFRVRVRELGDTSDDAWVNIPELHVQDRRNAPFSRMLVFRWDVDVEMPGGVPTVPPAPRKGWNAAYYTVPTQTVAPVGTGGWQANTHFYAGSGDTYFIGGVSTEPGSIFGGGEGQDNNFATTGLRNIRLTQERAEVFLDGLIPKGPIEIEIRRGQIYIADQFTYSSYTLITDPPADALTNAIYDHFGYATLDGDHIVILKPANAADEVVITRIATVWNQQPVARKGEFATVFVRAIGRSLDALSIVASGLVPDWDGAEWTGKHATSNPAPHYRDVLTGRHNDNRIPSVLVNDTTLLEWRQRCADLEFQCNAAFSGEHVDRVLEVIASCGYARPRQSEVWDVAQDRDFTNVTPVQMFTPRNMRGFRWEKAFIRHRPDGLRVRYNDATDNYVERTIVVPRLGIGVATPGRLEEIRYDGIVTEYEAVFKAIYDQQQVIDRFTFYYGEVDAEQLVCRRGDLVLVQHDTLDQFAGYSRVLEIESDGDLVETIRLDGTVSPVDAFFTTPTDFFDSPTPFFTSNVGAAIRRKDGTMVSFEAELSDDGFELTPVSSISVEGLERECLVSTGKLLRANRRMLVFNIRPKANLTADLTLVDEAPQLWQFPEPLEVTETFMRNRIINGSMLFNQRADLFSESEGTLRYGLDRWYHYGDPGTFEVTQETEDAPAGYDYYLRAEVTAQAALSYGYHVIGQPIERYDMAGFDWGLTSGRAAALTFNVRSSVIGTYYGVVQYGVYSYVFSYIIPVADEWLRRIITVPAPPEAAADLAAAELTIIEWSLGGTVGDTLSLNEWQASEVRRGEDDEGVIGTLGGTWDMTGVQFELAPATQFEWLPKWVQEGLVKRYFQAVEFDGNPMVLGTGVAISTTVARVLCPLPYALRSPPEVTVDPFSNAALQVASGTIAATNVTLVSPDDSGAVSGVALEVTVAAGLTAGQSVLLRVDAGTVLFDSEVDIP